MPRVVLSSDDEEEQTQVAGAPRKRPVAKPAQASRAHKRPKVPPPVCSDALHSAAQQVMQDVASRFPQHSKALRRILIETSARMQSSGAKTVFMSTGARQEPRPTCIRISLPIFSVRKNFDESLRDVMLHEIAHCIAGRTAAHGPSWRACCLSIGGTAALTHTLSCGVSADCHDERAHKPGPRQPARARTESSSTDGWRAATSDVLAQLIRF